ncbi:hypothetical protein RUM43_004122, partial [Polyplax serrata]
RYVDLIKRLNIVGEQIAKPNPGSKKKESNPPDKLKLNTRCKNEDEKRTISNGIEQFSSVFLRINTLAST